ncbi:hypothetical protein [Paraburkholderia sp. GAS32]|uniref:hypothetical protein n=1 Tax=Paraburkholderia sp. GAS32 TaxID=3035129 RepID=UPI003D255FF3
MTAVEAATNAVHEATAALNAAMTARATIGAELHPQATAYVVERYEAALEVEAKARFTLRDAINWQRDEQMRNAGLR